MSTWINFKELRGKLRFEQILRHYGVEVKRKGDQHHGFCPLPNHQGVKNSPSFSANLTRGIFQCFGCRASGNLLEFAALMQKIDLNDGSAIRKVALELQKKFCPDVAQPKNAEVKPATIPQPSIGPVIVNAPLDFELKNLDPDHPYLPGRGFLPETIDRFGLGFCARGFLKDRVAIPLHNHEQKLVGYAGRVVDDKGISEENPKYRFPGTRARGEKIFEFRKSLILYNSFRIKNPVDDLIIVEGFASVWWLTQMRRENVVSTMGANMSEEQSEIADSLVKPSGRMWIVSDGDSAGERWAKEVLAHLAPAHFCRWIKLPDAKQPTDYQKEFYDERLR